MNRFVLNPHAVALVLALSLGVTLILIVVNAILNGTDRVLPTLGENTTQVLTTIMGGIIGVLGSYIGQHGSDIHRSSNGGEEDKEK